MCRPNSELSRLCASTSSMRLVQQWRERESEREKQDGEIKITFYVKKNGIKRKKEKRAVSQIWETMWSNVKIETDYRIECF